MNPNSKRIASVLSLFMMFCVSQVYVAVSFAGAESQTTAAQGEALSGILTTVGNKPITVNTAAAITGTTILSGATIETPQGVGASISLGSLGSLEMEQDAKVVLTFQAKKIDVLLIKGCVTLRATKGTVGKIETSKQVVGKTDEKADGILRVCHPDSVRLAAAGVAVGGLGKLATLAIIAGPAAAIIPVITPGDNPSSILP